MQKSPNRFLLLTVMLTFNMTGGIKTTYFGMKGHDCRLLNDVLIQLLPQLLSLLKSKVLSVIIALNIQEGLVENMKSWFSKCITFCFDTSVNACLMHQPQVPWTCHTAPPPAQATT